jgi:uncharacterized protein YjbI with pentapeptide repeats
LSGSKFAEDADFSHAIFEGPADFSRSRFGKNASLFGAQFRKNAYLESCQIDRLNLTGTMYQWIFLHWDSIGIFESDEDAYRRMIKNYEGLRWQQDAKDCNSDYERRAGKVLWFLNII